MTGSQVKSRDAVRDGDVPPPKTNMEPKNFCFPIWNLNFPRGLFSGSRLVFGGVLVSYLKMNERNSISMLTLSMLPFCRDN